METNEKMLENFIKKYGRKGLRKLTGLFTSRTSNELIGEQFGVTRQRVHQWQQVFTETNVNIKPFVQDALVVRNDS